MKSPVKFGAIALLLIAGTIFKWFWPDWRDKVRPGLTATDPIQTTVQALPTPKTFGKTTATLTARAKYSVKAWVVASDDSFDDGYEDVLKNDLGLAWGPLGNRDILKTMKFHLARRYISVRWSGENPLDNKEVMRHLANHHLISSTDEIAKTVSKIKEGDLIELEGYLVDVEIQGRQNLRTSLSRDDVGNGACEILYVERAEIMPR